MHTHCTRDAVLSAICQAGSSMCVCLPAHCLKTLPGADVNLGLLLEHPHHMVHADVQQQGT